MATRRIRKKNASLLKLVDPKYLSVVKTPANRTAFKIIREAKSQDVETKIRSDDNLLSIDLPFGVDRATADYVLDLFGLKDDYEVSEVDGTFSLIRIGSDIEANTIPINLGEGIIANILSTSFANREDRKGDIGVELVKINFDSAKFPSLESVKRWIDSHEIDFKENGVKNTESGFSVIRKDISDKVKTETHEIPISDGVSGVIIRSSSTDVPKLIYRSVVESAYGNYGWGHLDFAAALVDPEFTEHSWEAIDALRNVLENIVFYSGLSLDDRKALIKNACDQYAIYMSNMIDALPADILRKSKSENILPEQENQDMVKTQDPNTEDKNVRKGDSKSVTTEDKVKKADSKEEIKTEESSNEESKTEYNLSREDVQKIVTEAVESAVSKLVDRQDKGETDTKETIGNVSNTLKSVADTMGVIMDSVKELKGQVEELGESTTVNRDDDDNDEKETKRSDSGTFRGLFKNVI